MSPVLPISSAEFLQLLQRCVPPGGWPHTLAVGNSGGPDSTCLLFLLSSILRSKEPESSLPLRLRSIHVNHVLQDASKDMSKAAAETAIQLGVSHADITIPWGVSPFPPRPRSGEAMESTARDTRSQLLFREMREISAGALAYAHHADDQVETIIMRLANGSSPLGAGGMRHVRRWGMGESSRALDHFGLEGMSRFIVRPLLSVPKSRILATCEANQLHYINDPTNFQPSLTIRNAIRYRLAQEERSLSGEEETNVGIDSDLPPNFQRAISQMHTTNPISPSSGLRAAAQAKSQGVEMIDTRVNELLPFCLLPSPPSVVILRTKWLQLITKSQIRHALVRRILRYVSPRPWGSVAAEAGGDQKSINNIITRVWGTAFRPGSRHAFSGGGEVLFIPGVVTPSGAFKARKHRAGKGEQFAWLFQRAPPFADIKLQRRGLDNPTIRDITSLLVDWETHYGPVQVLYDMRFNLTLDVAKMPKEIRASLNDGTTTRVVIEPSTDWFAPQVVWRRDGHDEVLADFQWLIRRESEGSNGRRSDASWIQIEPIRTLEAV